jgi:hypothetical protein
MAKTYELQSQALAKARGGESTCNYRAIVDGFLALGIAEGEIQPRVNVFTFHAWKALGRCVKKGQHGVKVLTYVRVGSAANETSGKTGFRMPRQTTVFHISQTEEIAGGAQ